jgi:hypothetical protein
VCVFVCSRAEHTGGAPPELLRKGGGAGKGVVLEDGKTLAECGLDYSMGMWEARQRVSVHALLHRATRACTHTHTVGGKAKPQAHARFFTLRPQRNSTCGSTARRTKRASGRSTKRRVGAALQAAARAVVVVGVCV